MMSVHLLVLRGLISRTALLIRQGTCTTANKIPQTQHLYIGQQEPCLRRFGSIHEPEYLDHIGHKVPTYELLNIQLKGYDFPVLERFQTFVHHTAESIGLDVEDSWGVPAQKLKITRLKAESTVVESEYQLNMYERTVQVADIPTTMVPLLINIVESSLPAGVSMSVQQHVKDETEIRFIPDLELKELKEQLTMDATQLKKIKIRFSPKTKFVK